MAIDLGPDGLTLGSTTVSDWDDVGGGFDSGTIMLFQQTSAPTGWTKITTHNDKALRVVSGTVGSGGSSGFTTALGTPSLSGSTGDTTLSTAQLASHTHGAGTYKAQLRHTGGGAGGANLNQGLSSTLLLNMQGSSGATGSGSSHNHTMSGTASINVQYVDVIFASRN